MSYSIFRKNFHALYSFKIPTFPIHFSHSSYSILCQWSTWVMFYLRLFLKRKKFIKHSMIALQHCITANHSTWISSVSFDQLLDIKPSNQTTAWLLWNGLLYVLQRKFTRGKKLQQIRARTGNTTCFNRYSWNRTAALDLSD